MIRRNRSRSNSTTTPSFSSDFLQENQAMLQELERSWQASQENLLNSWRGTMDEMGSLMEDLLADKIESIFGKLAGNLNGFAKDWVTVLGEEMGSSLAPLITKAIGNFGGSIGENLGGLLPFSAPTPPITLVNVVDPKFVDAAIEKNPRTVVNVINEDILKNGSTRKTIQSLT